MEPRIQYAKTGDGVSIAYCVAGEGSPVLFLSPPPFCHVQLDWQTPSANLLQPLAKNHRLVWFDWPGSGLSDHDAVDFSMEARVRAIEAVVARTGLEEFAVCAMWFAVPIAVTYGASQPKRVSHLILADGATSFAELEPMPFWQAERALRDKDWVIYTETYMRILWQGLDEALAKEMGEYVRACVKPEAHRAVFAAMERYDVSDLLPRVMAQTLVAQNRYAAYDWVEVGQRLAARITNSRFLVVEDPIWAGLPALVDEFLGEGEPTARTAEAPAAGAFRTVLFTDLVGHSEMMSRLGDAKGREMLREHERITREVLKQHGGTEVKTMGDGFMASFGSVTRAVECAMALQRAMGTLTPDPSPAGTGEGQSVFPLKVRCGLNAGEPIEEEGDLFGATVILAARIAARAEGGEILVANAVRELCSGKGFLFADRGEFVAKGFEEPVRVYEVSWREE